MKKHIVIPALFLALALFVTSSLLAQSPQGIPYQAVMRNADGSVMASSAVSLTFMIHDGTADGVVVYQESHALTSNAQGLVTCVVGNGVVLQGNFAQISWGNGAKFLHVMMGSDASLLDLGTQQMLSVPYALNAGGTHVSVSATGDTLTVGGQSVIVPGISAANPTINIPTSGLGAQVLPGNTTCANEYINVVGCNGQTSLTYDGRTYDLVEIGGQCWFADNLATDQYRNGDPIPTGLDNTTWQNTLVQNTAIGAYAIYNNDPFYDATYGKLYNWYATVDSRGLCPTGWHVPADCEWMYLEGKLGMSVIDQENGGWRGFPTGGGLKGTTNWSSPNSGVTNSSGFSALPGGYRMGDGIYWGIGFEGYWWSSTEFDPWAWYRQMVYSNSGVYRYNYGKSYGFSVRCIRDSEVTPPIQGCTDGAACNFMANANQDDGSCLYQNATCDDGVANTVNDVINGSCVCAGVYIDEGCTNPQACNYNAAASFDNGTCLYQNTTCDDGNVNSINDVINGNCTCVGTAMDNAIYTQGSGAMDIDGNLYTSIIINGQEWIQQNLVVTRYRNGDPIPTGGSNAAWQNFSGSGLAIYNNDAANNALYGKLYNWYAVNDSRGLCPTGWHVPSDAEWTTLENNLGGSGGAGGKMKSTTGWTSPNTGATNESAFTGLPGGYRLVNGTYGGIGNNGNWWSSTESGSNVAWYRTLGYVNSLVGRNYGSKLYGFSVRCVRD